MVKSASNNTPPVSASGSATGKRKKEEDDAGGSSLKKPRTRVSYSCGECHRRKQKCDRQVPCSHCVARKVPELCKAYQPGKSDQDVHMRLARLERIVEMALPQFCQGDPSTPSLEHNESMDRQRSESTGPEDGDRSPPEDQDPSGGIFQSGKWYGHSASGSVAPASLLEQLQHVVVTGSNPESRSHEGPFHSPAMSSMKSEAVPPISGYHQDSSLGAATAIIESVRQDSEASAADNLKSLVQDCGVSPHKISELLQELPPQRFSDVLIDYYFDSVNWTRYPLSERDFRVAYASICSNSVGMNPNDVRFLPLLFVVLAIAVRLAPEHIAGDARTRRLTSLRYYWSSRRSVLIAAAIQPDSLEMVLTRLLSARFLTFDRRITECWSQLGAAVRTAQALGLHRDGEAMGMDPARVEYRRRIWAYLYHADRSYALVLGRPNAIQDDYTSTHPPLNIEDESTLVHIRPSTPPPLSIPTRMTFVILRHALACIIGRMVHHFQQVRTSHYSDVLALDDELMRFVDTLPAHFSTEPDTSMDISHPYIPVHRYLLITEVWFVRISLHRPYLLRRLGSDRYARSRQACFDSAINDFQVRKAFREHIPRETRDSLSNAYREFQTAMVSGMYLVLDPRGKFAQAMHAILDAFLSEHEGVRDMDETTRRELKIIEFLKTKSISAQTNGHGNGTTGVGHLEAVNGVSPHMDAQLLLGLQQSATPVRNSPLSHAKRPSFPSLVTPGPSTKVTSPPLSYRSATASGSGRLPPSASHRIPQSQHTDTHHPSPTTSGSPGADDESTAQSLLDHWCNSVSGGSLESSSGMASMGWNTPSNPDMSGWFSGPTPPIVGSDIGSMGPLDGSDWTYWETLVNQIRGPVA
ncbi:hypothetical protein JAAARDRAFT_28196 [Jaapia argillacea MUCL 33604]|uniref:Zn(2)-C6 fungal-type domain-containing protein n=1 Tax=Jaapia argillacea MUCL 33604 TaxID=933084 RepID=A0A067QPJ0_9AGAM|nr:hypothetical protein JAAARDRAFT_28196 [Jaapia argillacea MUCL 33604]